MAAALIIVLAMAAMFLMAAPAPFGASPDPVAETKAAHLILVHQSAVDSVRGAGSPGPGRLPDGFVVYPDWFAASGDFVSGSNGGAVVATWLEAEPRLWGEVAMALGRRKPTKAAVGTIDRSTGSPELVATFEGRRTAPPRSSRWIEGGADVWLGEPQEKGERPDADRGRDGAGADGHRHGAGGGHDGRKRQDG